MIPIVEFCMSNLAEGTHPVLEALERDADIDVVEYGCLGKCTLCAKKNYAIVEGKIISGSSAEELLEKIYKELEDNDWI
ncbi:DUF1450 domain-containing protein [Geomicrobium sp. JSM 1781026]|uniref:DUF1450 domain-containing protein n=1 Tax=Geomicrobium sp. JSM 1781026 TaxID=3344580 RepID=UPI0035BED7C9